MRRIDLWRWAKTDKCVIGRIGPWFTLEPPDRDNKPRESCIPAGEYVFRRSYYNAGKYPVFEAENVPGRSQILIHIGNGAADTEGCILIGMHLISRSDGLAVYPSRPAFNEFMASLKGEDAFTLVVRDA